MSLQEYQRKRHFRETPEPRGRLAPRKAKARSFVVQLHHARARHYDFRLEVDGVLRSWAVPKGPSFRAGEKRLAVEVEDHPLSYASFEGTIPEGHYGAGHVAVFDRGTWTTEDDPAQALERGSLDFELKGSRLKGSWKLVRTGKRGVKPQWLLFKRNDSHAGDFEADDLLEGVTAKRESTRARGTANGTKKAASTSAMHQRLLDGARSLPGARRAGKTGFIAPMLTTAAKLAPEGDGWLHEWKWDGYRLIAATDPGGAVRLWSRNGLDWNGRVPELEAALAELDFRAVFDGELIAVDAKGYSDFNALQAALKSGKTDQLRLAVFDLPRLGDIDLSGVELQWRKILLRELLKGSDPRLFYSDHVVGHGPEVFAAASQRGMEGIISKRADAAYRSGRSSDWLKVKTQETREFVAVGYTQPKGSRKGIGALLLAQLQKGKLVYAGRVGSGLSDAMLQELPRKLQTLETSEPVVALPAHTPLPPGRVHWVKPQLVVEVIFRGWGKEGLLRQASFSRLRADRKPAADLEQPEPLPTLTSPTRIVYPDIKATKQQVYDYYLAAAEPLLAEISGRLLSVVRCPDGIEGQRFFQKHAGKGFGDSVKRVRIKEADGGTAEYFHVDDVSGLMNLVQMNAIEFHPWGSHVADLERPDRMVFDLDPDPALAWKDVRRAAVEIRDRLANAGLPSYPRLTGGKGVHVVVPLRPHAGWDQVRNYCEALAGDLARAAPDRYVATMSKAKREGRIFIDWLRNGRGATSVAAWSLRARPGAPAAMLLTWDELTRIRRPDGFSIANAAKRDIPEDVAQLIAGAPVLPVAKPK
jgi:bifunctional non-homologous end joining protein LigD